MITFGHTAMFNVISLFILYLEISALQKPHLDVRRHKNWRLIDHGTICGRGISTYSKEGQRNLKNRILGGKSADWNDYPWLAKLKSIDEDFTEYNCGSSVINNQYLLTAAHCCLPTDNANDNIIYKVEINTAEGRPESRAVEKVTVHEGYNTSDIKNDVCLIRLRKPLQFSGAVQPICLPSGPKWETKNLEGLSMTITGWGLLTEDPDVYPNTLQAVNVTVAPTKDCVRQWDTAPDFIRIFPEEQLCAGTSKKDACSGDSGGPVMYWDAEGIPRYFLTGMVSFGNPCSKDKTGRPGVFARTSHYIPWILNNIHK